MKINSRVKAEFIFEPIIGVNGCMIGGCIREKFKVNDIYLNDKETTHTELPNEILEKILVEKISIIDELLRKEGNKKLIFSISIEPKLALHILRNGDIKAKISSNKSLRVELKEVNIFDLKNPYQLIEEMNAISKIWLQSDVLSLYSLKRMNSLGFEKMKVKADFLWRNGKLGYDTEELRLCREHPNKIIAQGVSVVDIVEHLKYAKVYGMQGWIWSTIKLQSGFFRQANHILSINNYTGLKNLFKCYATSFKRCGSFLS